MGADRAVLCKDAAFDGCDAAGYATILAAAIRKLGGADLVLLGKHGVGDDNQQMGALLAEMLDLPQVTVVVKLEAARAELKSATDKVAGFSGSEPAERARLELTRDEQLRRVQDEEKRYQIAKDLSDNLTISYNTSEVVMARLLQTTNAKERIYAQSITFFSTNDSVLTALKASFTGMFGLHESTATLNAMKEGVSKSLETLSEIGGKVQEEAVKAGYGPTVRADAVKKLVDSVVSYQEHSQQIIDEMRKLATQNSAEIRDAVEDGKRRIAKLVADGKALPL